MGNGNYAEDRVYKKVIRAQAGQDFSKGPRPRAIMLSGTNAEIHAFDQYGNGFTLDNLAKVGTTMYSVAVETVDHVVEDASTKTYILF